MQAVTEPGDWVIVENPCFYGALQALERLRLKALSVATDVKEGIDLQALELALQDYPVKACWLMTNSQNPLGFTLTPQKAQLVALLNQYNVTLIEDDVYSELYFGREKPLPAKRGIATMAFCIALRFRNVCARFSYWLGRRRKTCT